MTTTAMTTVIIVTYNAADDLVDCVEHLSDSSSLEIIVVDNCSADGTRDLARQLVDEGKIRHLIENAENVGFARAVNRGILDATTDAIFLLNPDARISGKSVDRLREIASNDDTIGILAPMIDSGPNVPTLAAGKQPRLWPLFTHFSGLARALPSVPVMRGRHLYRSAHSYTQDVEWVSGCALYITPPGLAAAGKLSERWFMYGEDIELAQRVLNRGLRVVMTSEVLATHEIGGAVNRTESAVSTMWAKNTYDYYKQQFDPGPVRRILWRTIFSLGLLGRAIVLRARNLGKHSLAAHAARTRAHRFQRYASAVWHN